jgi:predicted nucleotidyltransferase
MGISIRIDRATLERFCAANHIRRMSLFGSQVARASQPDSDLDVLVEFEASQQPGLIGLARMSAELSAMIDGRPVDLRTPKELSRHFREEVLRTAEVVFAR